MTKHKLLPEIEVTIPKGATHYRGFINQQPSWYKSAEVEDLWYRLRGNPRRWVKCQEDYKGIESTTIPINNLIRVQASRRARLRRCQFNLGIRR